MALVTCPECGRRISNLATVCPLCGFPMTSNTDVSGQVIVDENTASRKESKAKPGISKRKKSIFVLVLLASVCVVILAVLWIALNKPKGSEYLHEWMLEHGVLVGGTQLQYTDYYSDGTKFVLCYDNNKIDSQKWYVECSYPETSYCDTTVKLTLFWEGEDSPGRVVACGTGNIDEYYRYLEFTHTPAMFASNSPITVTETGGSTAPIGSEQENVFTDDGLSLRYQLLKLDARCSACSQAGVCKILDWLKESFCPEADMSMDDFGYTSYK